MELRHLRYFIAVAEELQFTRAAVRLHIAQPPLSQQIHRLERELGVTLFERSRHGVRLTDAGIVLLERARRLIEAEEDAMWSTRRAALGEVGRIVVGFSGTTALDILADVVAAHRGRFPGVRIVLREVGSRLQVDQLLERMLDVGLLRERVTDDRIRIVSLRREPFVAVLPARHRLAHRASISFRDLAEEPFVLAPRGQSVSSTQSIDDACAAAGFRPNVVQEAAGPLSVLGMVAAGVGVSLQPAALCALRMRGVVYRPLRDGAPMKELAVARRADNASRLVSAFIETCRTAVAENAGAASGSEPAIPIASHDPTADELDADASAARIP